MSTKNNPSIDIPRTLLRRDPRNPAHLASAMELVGELGHLIVTMRTVDELAKLGVALPKKSKVRKKIGKHDAVVGGFYFLDREVSYPNNVIVTCNDCRTALEIRPQSNTGASKLCLFCAVDRLLKAYWESKSGSSDSH